jgi:hypothetical protein
VKISDDTAWTLLMSAGAFGASFATKALLQKSWRGLTGKKPPTNPAAAETAWSEALVWTAATSLAAGLARLIAKRQAARFKAGDVPTLH